MNAAAGAAVTSCLLCGGALRPKFVTPTTRLHIAACRACGAWMLAALPSDDERRALYGEHYFDSWGDPDDLASGVYRMKQQTFRRFFRALGKFHAPGRLLDVGCAFGASLAVAQQLGWDVTGLELNPHAAAKARVTFGERILSAEFETAPLAAGSFDALVMSDVLEHLPNPRAAMTRVHQLLRDGGVVVINTPCVDSLSARLLQRDWPNLKAEHLCYPSRRGVTALLRETGFACVRMQPTTKVLNLLYVDRIMQHYAVRVLTPCVRRVIACLPPRWRQYNFSTRSGEMFVIARKITRAS